MVAFFDRDQSGKLSTSQFDLLWKRVMYCAELFKKHGKNGNRMMNSAEFRNALLDSDTVSITVNQDVIQALMLRYGEETAGKDGLKMERLLSFEGFINCRFKLIRFRQVWSAVLQQTNEARDFALPGLNKFLVDVLYT